MQVVSAQKLSQNLRVRHLAEPPRKAEAQRRDRERKLAQSGKKTIMQSLYPTESAESKFDLPPEILKGVQSEYSRLL